VLLLLHHSKEVWLIKYYRAGLSLGVGSVEVSLLYGELSRSVGGMVDEELDDGRKISRSSDSDVVV
jgi:hypothetical protein